MSKTFENASRADAQSIDPLYLCIIGGKALPEDERGPLDTDLDPDHPMHAHDLLRPLNPIDVDDVFDQGVIVAIEVVRMIIDGVERPVVNWGRGRVRKARKANIRRAREGLPLIQIKFCVVRITDKLQLFRRAVAENLRRKTMGTLDQIELAKQFLARGAGEEDAAKTIGIPLTSFRKLLIIEDNATPAVKLALQQDRLSPSAAVVLAEIKDPAEQDAKLAELLAAPKPTVRAARALRDKNAPTPPRRPVQKKLLESVEKHTRGNEWMKGAQAALQWVLEGTIHKDLAELLESEEESDEAADTAGKKKPGKKKTAA